jgi:hypothetical protein
VLLDYHDHPYSFELHLANGGLIYFEVGPVFQWSFASGALGLPPLTLPVVFFSV